MNETKFKVLMYNGFYVDIRLIEGGIYSSYIPCIYSKDKTIESLIEDGRRVKDMTGAEFITEEYFENLKLCQLVDITIGIDDTESKI